MAVHIISTKFSKILNSFIKSWAGYLIIGMTMGQVLSLFLFALGIGLFLKKNEN